MNKKRVRHDDIKPGNIFLRGSDVFLGGKSWKIEKW